MALISIDAMSNEICKISDSFHHTKFALSLVHFVARCGQFLVSACQCGSPVLLTCVLHQ